MAREAPPAILEATLRVIAADGVDAVRYRRVADEAGLPLGTVSYHFTSREALIRAAFARYLAQNTTAFAEAWARSSAQTIEGVAAYLAELVRADFADPRRRFLAEYELVVYAARDPVIARGLAAWDRAVVAELAEALERLGLRRPIAAARTAVDVVRGFQVANLGAEAPALDDLRSRLAEVLAALAGAPGEQPPRARTKGRAPRRP